MSAGGEGSSARKAGVLELAALLAAMCCVQAGAAFAQRLFPLVGPQGTTALRASMAALILLALRRPRIAGLSRKDILAIVTYGLALGSMNLLFYLAIARIPLGVAVTMEFAGPLVLSVMSHRRVADVLWLALATGGLLLLAPFQGHAGGLDPVGLALALGAGACWAIYILAGRLAGAALPGGAVAAGMAVAAVLVLPIGVLHAGGRLLHWDVLPLALLVAVLSSALPYSLEMFALPRVPRVTFSALMSLEPAIAALSGLLFLGQTLNIREFVAIGCIMTASAGAAIAYLKDAPAA
ncbi:MAG TPA: EamA family transporter [Caulobacteraceae bacterium]